MAHNNNRDIFKQMEFAKKQQQLKDLGTSFNNGHSKVLSADSMIEDLLSKKETFQKRTPDVPQAMEAPSWLRGGVPLYDRVWAGVQTAGGLADTHLLSSLLISSGLSTDTLGYIWSLANHAVPGALTQQELYSVLAMVGLAQTGYVVNAVNALYQLPQPPLPSLDLALLPTHKATPQVYPSPLNVTSLPEPSTFAWSSTEAVNSSFDDKIGVSYVSAAPMVSPNLLADQATSPSSFNMGDRNPPSKSRQETKFPNNPTAKISNHFKSAEHVKHSGNTIQFSFPKLNESPSHTILDKNDECDPFDDEFSDFQSADFTSATISNDHDIHCNPATGDNEEFLGFQKAPSNFDTDDLSVLVIDGKNTTSAQQLWVSDSLDDKESFSSIKGKASEKSYSYSEAKHSNSAHNDKSKLNKYDVFNNIDEDKYNIFHNPLPDEEDRINNKSENAAEISQSAPTSSINHSLLNEPDTTFNLFQSNIAPYSVIEKFESDKQVNVAISTNVLKYDCNDDDEFTNFQTFSPFEEGANENSIDDKIDKYDVFRTIVFEDTTNLHPETSSKPEITVKGESDDLSKFDIDTVSQNQADHNKFSDSLFEDNNFPGEMIFGDFQESTILPEAAHSKIDDLFSSLSISEKDYEQEIKEKTETIVTPLEDKYKALRLLETETVADDFGEFLGADLPGDGDGSVGNGSKKSVQIRVLEECLNILKEGIGNMSKLNGLKSEEIPDIFREPRVKFYLDCLMEIHRVSEYIICNMEGDTSAHIFELKNIWKSLLPYYVYSEHNLLPETSGAVCGICKSSTGPSPITFGVQTFHAPCANLYIHCIGPVLPNIASTTVK